MKRRLALWLLAGAAAVALFAGASSPALSASSTSLDLPGTPATISEAALSTAPGAALAQRELESARGHLAGKLGVLGAAVAALVAGFGIARAVEQTAAASTVRWTPAAIRGPPAAQYVS